jgi:hypothetical protein
MDRAEQLRDMLEKTQWHPDPTVASEDDSNMRKLVRRLGLANNIII